MAFAFYKKNTLKDFDKVTCVRYSTTKNDTVTIQPPAVASGNTSSIDYKKSNTFYWA